MGRGNNDLGITSTNDHGVEVAVKWDFEGGMSCLTLINIPIKHV
jgi:hypothetical protein